MSDYDPALADNIIQLSIGIVAVLALIISIIAEVTASRAKNVAQDAQAPVLQRIVTEDITNEKNKTFYDMGLHNVGGPLYKFKVSKIKGNIVIAFSERVSESGEKIYSIGVNIQGKHPLDRYDCSIAYTYEDKFGRKFKAIHDFTVNNCVIDPRYDVGRPKKV